MKHLFPILLLCALVLSACGKDDSNEQDLDQDAIIASFIADNNLEGEFMQDGIFVSIENPGTGQKPTVNNTVDAYYEGKYVSDGEIFDGNIGAAQPATFPLSQVIPGWTKGIPYFGVGDKGWLVLPSDQAYGNFPPSGVRANAAMAFYVELVAIK